MLTKLKEMLSPLQSKQAHHQTSPGPSMERNESLAPDRWKVVTDQTIRDHYKRYPHSFADKLSVMEYRQDSRTFELEDGFSQAVVLTCTPIPTEGRDEDTLVQIQRTLAEAFQKSFASEQSSQWIVEFYAYREEGLHRYVKHIEEFIAPEIRQTALTQDYLQMMTRHLKGVNRDGGIFFDQQVTSSNFQGQLRQCKLIIYRRCTLKEQTAAHFCPAEEVNTVAETFTSLLESTGTKFTRDTGKDFHDWLTTWFNPKPHITDGSLDDLRDLIGYPTDESETPYGYNLSENVVHSQPISDPQNKCWWFDGVPHQYIRCTGLMRRPKHGQLTGEIRSGAGKSTRSSSIMDNFPSGAIFHQTIVIQSDRDIDKHLDMLGGMGKSDTKDAIAAENALDSLQQARIAGAGVYKSSMGVFIRANPKLSPEEYLQDLKKTRSKVQNLMLMANMIPQDIDTDEQQIESYTVHLPMNFEPKHDKYGIYLGLYYDTDLVDLCPLWGRERGTGNPGFLSFNRGGELVTFDMFGVDKVRSSHGVLIGPQGSGKSAALNAIAQAVMAMYRPYLYILDKGGSFRLMGDYFERLGLKVKRLKLTPGARNVHLCPYADSHLIFDEKYNDSYDETDEDLIEDPEDDEDEEDDDEAKRDPMGEMLRATIIMVTGGKVEQSNLITQTHRTLFEEAITLAATRSLEEQRQTIVSDVCDALAEVVDTADVDLAIKNEMKNYLVALRGWTTGFRGKIFNSVGQTFDDKADVTIIDVSTFAGENYEAELSVVYVALSTHLFNVGEKNQASSRDLVYLQDESHLYSSKPLLAPFMATAVKLMRKIGIKALYATQNLEDFKYGSEKILKLVEWWIALNLESPEIKELDSYRPLTKAQQEMLYSCTKQPRCYTEGVVMGNRQKVGEMLVRFVPPSEILAYSMTDPEEKAKRKKLRADLSINKDIDAARYMAEQLDISRKIIEPEDATILDQIHKEQQRAA